MSGEAPRIVPARGSEGLAFSFSASGGIAAVALTVGQRLGIDVECVTAERFSEGLAGVVLCDAERESFAETAVSRRAHWLASTWVAKEALLKAWGHGLAVAPDLLDAGLDGGDEPESRRRWRRLRVPSDWWVWEAGWPEARLAVAATSSDSPVRMVEHSVRSLYLA
jgi:phosphopantetheinyl transferase